MSLLPLLFSNWWEDLERPHHVRDQHFGLGMRPEHLSVLPGEVLESRLAPYLARAQMRNPQHAQGHYYRPWGELLRRENDGGLSTLKADKDSFQAVLDVQQFSPEEINVKVVDKYILVEGSHEEKQDEHGWISRKFTRKYLIPEQCNLEKAESRLSSDGVLTITVPRKEKPKVEGARVINIQHTGKPAVTEKQSDEKKADEKK
ncbi:hypothetical protein QAD02_015481 [Eretmocerus hayati]|uniref:Uncharacterized protein n=1 Tax=Eretmocerus hayati TaxID=131215 RepID=A0ACC2P8U2_9HYME|nr:hypothetical protein QAD02_015481 [Eretmocerus hayati]